MGYMIPLRFIKVSNRRKIPNEKKDVRQFDVSICATRIVAMMSTDIYQARRTIHDEKKSGTLINACGTSAAKTAIFLDNGSVVASPLSVQVLLNSIEKANQKAVPGQTKRLKVYDVEDEEPNPEIDEFVSEFSYHLRENGPENDFEEDDEYEDE